MGKKRKSLPPSKVIITMGEKLTQTQYSGKVSGVNLLNAAIHIINDIQETTGMAHKGALAIVAEKFGYRISPLESNPTMRASKSDATAKSEEDDAEEHD